jgi:hypothetical protein
MHLAYALHIVELTSTHGANDPLRLLKMLRCIPFQRLPVNCIANKVVIESIANITHDKARKAILSIVLLISYD